MLEKSKEHGNTEKETEFKIGWGVDGFGFRHFICDRCGARLGKSRTVQPFDIKHACGDGRWTVGEVVNEKGREGQQGQIGARASG